MPGQRNTSRLLPLEGFVAAFGAITVALGAVLYALGRSYQDAVLASYGLSGAITSSTFEAMLAGVRAVPELLLGLGVGGALLILIGVFYVGRKGPEVRSSLLYMNLIIFTCGIAILVGIVATLIGAGAASAQAATRAVECTPCFEYRTREGAVVGYPLMAGDVYVAVALDGDTARLIRWEEVRAVRRLNARPRYPSNEDKPPN